MLLKENTHESVIIQKRRLENKISPEIAARTGAKNHECHYTVLDLAHCMMIQDTLKRKAFSREQVSEARKYKKTSWIPPKIPTQIMHVSMKAR